MNGDENVEDHDREEYAIEEKRIVKNGAVTYIEVKAWGWDAERIAISIDNIRSYELDTVPRDE